MLCLTRRPGESIQIGHHVVVAVNCIREGRVSLAISAPIGMTHPADRATRTANRPAARRRQPTRRLPNRPAIRPPSITRGQDYHRKGAMTDQTCHAQRKAHT
jgi:hypothetical protein